MYGARGIDARSVGDDVRGVGCVGDVWGAACGGLTHGAVSAKIQVRPLSITVSTTGFHPVNAGSTPAEVTM